MAYFLYKYIRNKRREKKARADALSGLHSDDDTAPTLRQTETQPVKEQLPPEEVYRIGSWTVKRSLVHNITLLVALAFPVYLETLDYTVVATAQPIIASHFDRLDLQSWIGEIYLLTSTVFLPLYASVADVYGRHFALQSSLFLFLIGSAICTGAMSMPTLLVGRGISGVGAAGMLTLPRIILADTASVDAQANQTSILFVLYAIGYCTGPIIGGALSTVDFRWIFAINMPVTVLAMILAFLLLRGHEHEVDLTEDRVRRIQGLSRLSKVSALDWFGTGLFVVAGILVLLALNWGSTEQWDTAKVIACFVVGGVLFFLCVGWEVYMQRRQDAERNSRLDKIFPMLPTVIFTSIDVVACQAVTFAAGMVMLVMFYYLSIFYVIVVGSSATNSGVQLLYFAPGLGVGSIMNTFIIKATGQPKWAMTLGTTVTTVSLGVISMGVANNNQGLVKGMLIMAGAGVGLSFAPAAVHARFAQPSNRVAIVSAYQRFFQSFGGTIGLAQAAAVLNSKVSSYLKNLVVTGQISPADAATLSGSSASSVGSINSLPPALHSAVQDAFRDGTRWLFISLVPWVGITVFLTLILTNITDPEKERKKALAEKRGDATELKEKATPSPRVD
ncbi:MFS general substrate transporter [Peniophora sp. CONT]|nr:MFS general substrate transporter [Peniophora sp. CONT]